FENDSRVIEGFVDGTRPPVLRIAGVYGSALVKVELLPGSVGVIRDEIKFVPEAVQLLLGLLVEDQFHQRNIVAPVSHHVVISGAKEPSFVVRIVREIPATF